MTSIKGTSDHSHDIQGDTALNSRLGFSFRVLFLHLSLKPCIFEFAIASEVWGVESYLLFSILSGLLTLALTDSASLSP